MVVPNGTLNDFTAFYAGRQAIRRRISSVIPEVLYRQTVWQDVRTVAAGEPAVRNRSCLWRNTEPFGRRIGESLCVSAQSRRSNHEPLPDLPASPGAG